MKKILLLMVVSSLLTGLILFGIESNLLNKKIISPNNTHDNINSIENAQINTLPISCECIILDKNKISYPINLLEFGDTVIILEQGKKIIAYNVKENRKIYEIQLFDSEKAFAPMFFKYNKKKGYDYCVAYDDQIVFLNSKDRDILYRDNLPVKLDRSQILYSERIYSFTEKHFVFLTKEGINIMHKSSSKNTLLSNENVREYIIHNPTHLNLSNNSISNIETVSIFDVQFLNGNERIGFCAANVEYTLMFFGIYNLITNEIEMIISHNEDFSVNYYAFSKVVTFSDYTNTITLDVSSFDIIKYHFNNSDYIIPEKQLSIYYSAHKNERLGLEVYYCPDNNYDNKSKLLIKINDNKAKCDIIAVCDKFIYLKLDLESEKYLIAIENINYGV